MTTFPTTTSRADEADQAEPAGPAGQAAVVVAKRRPRRRGSAGMLPLLACAALLLAASGCSRHLIVAEAGPIPGERGAVSVAIQPTDGTPVEGLMVEILDEDGDLVTRIFTETEPRLVKGLPPGTYQIRVYGEEIGAGILEAPLEVEPGMCIAVAYEDGERRRQAWNRFLKTSGQVLEVTGQVLLVSTVVAARVALIVLSCGCAS